MSDKFTQADADRIHEKWRGILGITMRGRIELLDKIDNVDGRIAECNLTYGRNRYLIKLSNPDLRGSGGDPPDVDDDICHELLHVITWFCCTSFQDAPIAMEAYEASVDHLAGVLVRLHRGTTKD